MEKILKKIQPNENWKKKSEVDKKAEDEEKEEEEDQHRWSEGNETNLKKKDYIHI